MHDLILTGGMIVDGTGAAQRHADVAIADGLIVAVGDNLGAALETIDARGLLVMPGFIDVHTHFDGQATWDDRMEPAVWHGITTAVMGNCGVGVAPVRPDGREHVIDMMATVEDIPPEPLRDAVPWTWSNYPDYLRSLDAQRRTIDLASMIPHALLRVYVMGPDRAKEEPTDTDLAEMARLVEAGMRAGAVGLSVSRTILHTTTDNQPLPGTFASENELVVLAQAVRRGGGDRYGVMEVSPASSAFPEPTDYVTDIELLIRVARRSACPVVFSLLQSNHAPDDYRLILDRVDVARAQGVRIHPEVGTRPLSSLMTLRGNFHPFYSLPSFSPLRDMPVDDRIAALRDPALRARLLAEENPHRKGLELLFDDPGFWSRTFPLRAPEDYYSGIDRVIQSIADAQGLDPRAVAFDALMENDGRGILMYAVANWARRTRDDLHAMVTHPASILGLGDGGAHLTATVDVSQPTTFLAGWVRDARPDGLGMTLEAAVKKLSLDNALAFGLSDRGSIAPGKRADINIVDLARLRVDMPVLVHDLPMGYGRLDQKAHGYVATIVAGQVIQREGVLTGSLPGRLAVGIGG